MRTDHALRPSVKVTILLLFRYCLRATDCLQLRGVSDAVRTSERRLALLVAIIAPRLALCPAVASGVTVRVTVGDNVFVSAAYGPTFPAGRSLVQ